MHSLWLTVLHQMVMLLLQSVFCLLLVLVHCLWPTVRRWLNQHVSQQERQLLSTIGHEAYIFAESVYAGHGGDEKLQQALTYALAVLGKSGQSFTVGEIRAAIENAVRMAKRVEVAGHRSQATIMRDSPVPIVPEA
ncbi:hypothetical protein GCM10025857_30860 [Alicyclobacillus contaminans]|uniref:phage holin, LLH family n=1 Tax=Alicyclobacillus contaminans TaxID=392016 RepID=UPI0003FE0E00|nr:phage holin, LLH family [Alicyclobacillus contaminans]GMA51729.1 hypothetical protein GCM10025857_30860 [Alicyclobacillus contaminans]